LVGKPANDSDTYRHAADDLVHGAKTYGENEFKVELARRTIVRALTTVSKMA